MKKPWTSGPRELLEHADAHLQKNSAFDHRIAFISIDNAVELMIRTFLSIPKRARGRRGPPRKKIEMATGFPDLLDLLEEYADDLIQGIELGDIEWYHRIRNSLYHDGNGITIDKNQLDAYKEIAKILYQNLFKVKLESSPVGVTGAFLETWASFENRVRSVAMHNLGERKVQYRPIGHLIEILAEKSVITDEFVKRVRDMQKIRNSVAHGYSVPGLDAGPIMSSLHNLINELPDAKPSDTRNG